MKKISDVLSDGAVGQDVLRAARAQRAMKNWDKAVGEILSIKSIPDRYEHGTLWVVTEAAAWGQEISIRQEMILDRLNELAGEPGLFRKIRITSHSSKSRD